MQDFSQSINAFLSFRRFEILPNKGKVSKKTADQKAINEYEEFNKTQKITSDFDKTVRKMLKGNKS